jgi:hypothetical protein
MGLLFKKIEGTGYVIYRTTRTRRLLVVGIPLALIGVAVLTRTTTGSLVAIFVMALTSVVYLVEASIFLVRQLRRSGKNDNPPGELRITKPPGQSKN